MQSTHQRTTQEIASYFKTAVKWDLFFSMLDTIGKDLDGPKDRFDKSDILELSMEIFSDKKIIYKNEEGRDLYIPFFSVFCEMKFDKDSLYTLKRKDKKPIFNLTLVNTMGNRDEVTLPSGYAPFVLAVGMHGCAVVSKKDIESHLKKTKDQIQASVPIEYFEIIKQPHEINRQVFNIQNNYKNQKKLLQENFLKSFLITEKTPAAANPSSTP